MEDRKNMDTLESPDVDSMINAVWNMMGILMATSTFQCYMGNTFLFAQICGDAVYRHWQHIDNGHHGA